MKIAVFGIGYVGCVTAAVLAREGHAVTGVDTNPMKVDLLRRGETPVLEPGLLELVRRAHIAGRLTATTDSKRALADAEVVFICVGTPSNAAGGLDATALTRVATEIGAGIRGRSDFPVIVLRSTALPEIVEKELVPALENGAAARAGEAFGFVVNPEFLREGTAIEDFDHPQYTLLGADESRSSQVVERLYGFLSAPTVVTDRRTATLVKYANNAFHALKVTFANEIGLLSASAGVDGRDVMRLLCLDTKLNISPAYLRPGMPFGGSCLPKDVRAAVYCGRRNDLALPVLNAMLESNRLQIEACTRRILEHGRARIGIFGMSFKAGTDDLRESPMVAIIETLIGKGLQIAIYDARVAVGQLVGANREYIQQHLPHVATLLRPTVDEVLRESDVLVVGTGDAEFARIPELMRPDQVLIDLIGVPREPTKRRASAGKRS